MAWYSFSGSWLPSLSINKVAINKDLEQLPPQLYQIKTKICYDQDCNDIRVHIAMKWCYYLFYLQQYFSTLHWYFDKKFVFTIIESLSIFRELSTRSIFSCTTIANIFAHFKCTVSYCCSCENEAWRQYLE